MTCFSSNIQVASLIYIDFSLNLADSANRLNDIHFPNVQGLVLGGKHVDQTGHAHFLVKLSLCLLKQQNSY